MKNKVIEIMKERGYDFSFEQKNGKDETISLNFWFNPDSKQNKESNSERRFPIPAYSIKVFLTNLEFQFSYACNNSIDILNSPKCSSFMNDEHFYRLAMKE